MKLIRIPQGILLLLLTVCFSQGYSQTREDHSKEEAKKEQTSERSPLMEDFFQEHGWRSGRIVGGDDALIQDYPWQVALMQGSTQFCGGSIIHEQWILTAAHCVQGSWNAEYIRSGVTNKTDTSGQDIIVAEIIVHPLYGNPVTHANDIALLRLASPLDLTDLNVSIVDIATQADAAAGLTDPGAEAFITGWGALSQGGSATNILQAAKVNLVSNEDAMDLGGYSQGSITPDMLCAGDIINGGTDACQGDSGGPLVVNDNDGIARLAGVTSWGFGCAQPLYPGIYARVSFFEEWITAIVPFADAGAPAAPSAFIVSTANDGSLQADISWVNPSVTFGNDSLTELSSIKIIRDEVLIHTLENPVPGAAASYTDNSGTLPGFSTWSIYAENTAGESPRRYSTVYIGEDVPAAPLDIQLSAAGNNGLLIWQPPANGANGSYFVPANTTYTISRMPCQEVVAQDITVTEFIDTNIPQQDSYYYIIRAGNSIGQGHSAASNMEFLGNENLFAVTIGDGNLPLRVPFNFFFRHSLTQSLFFPEETGQQSGIISGIQYYNNFALEYQQRHITIYLGETNKTNLTEGWIDSSGLQLVFDGMVDFPQGENNIYIPLQTEYVYAGGNLVVSSSKTDDEYHFHQMFYGTNGESPGRTRVAFRDSNPYDHASPPSAGMMLYDFPNTTLIFSTRQLGSLQGSVSNADGVMAGVKVKIKDHYFSTHTDSQGFYSFAHLPVGSYEVEFSFFGYYPKESGTLITSGDTSTANAVLSAIPAHTVSGQISANDGLFPNAAVISLAGYDDYTALTDTNGNFIIEDVFQGVYSLSVAAEGYDTHYNGELTVDSSLHLEIELTETINTPLRLNVNIDDHPNGQALFSWNQPALIKLCHHSGPETPNGLFQSKQRVYGTVFDIENYPDAVLSHIDFHHLQWNETGSNYPYTVYVVDWDSFEILATIGPLSTTIVNGWEEMIGMDSIVVGGLSQVAILINSLGGTTNNAYPCITGDKSGPHGLSVSAPLDNLQDYTINSSNMGDFLINMWISSAAGKGRVVSLPIAQKQVPTPKFNIYLNNQLKAENHPEATYMFDDLAEGHYTAGVQSVYTTGTSDVVSIDFEMVYDVSGQLIITSNSGVVAAGAVATLRNNGNPDFEYTGISDETGVMTLVDVRKGSYYMEIALEGFELYEQHELLVDQEDFIVAAELQEVITAPTTLHVQTRDMEFGTALFSWNNTFEPSFKDSFEDQTFNAWGQFIPGSGTGGEAPKAFWHIGRPDGYSNGATAPDGDYVGKVHWGYNIDTWLITPSFLVEDYSKVSFYWNSNYNWSVSPFPHAELMVKISVDQGQTWQQLWNWQHIGQWQSFVWYNSVISLQEFTGQNVKIAFQLLANNNANTQIDNIVIGWADAEGDFRISESPEGIQDFARSNDAMLKAAPKSFPAYNVFLDDELMAESILQEELLFTGLQAGSYTAGVQSVYASGTSEIISIDFTLESPPPPVFPLTFTVVDNLKTFDNIWIKGEMTDPSWTEINLQQGPASIWKTSIGVSPGTYRWTLGGEINSGEYDWQLPGDVFQEFTLNNDGSITGQLSYMITSLSAGNTEIMRPMVYPNPARDMITIESADLIKRVMLTDNAGRLVRIVNVNSPGFELDISELETGMYILQVFTQNSSFTEKIQIIK